ncbi:PP2C family protein-serine/threonine phosphatase [Streptomyces sp. ITFR-6]|nr:PP2C family protein-serine/threonine phosphatase [Streptomyces sp. ITFR-6]WNI33700.1 PP2C family protein-serine/threonine phosphatase [Streptomyces sp. ITFR-6]
MSGAHSLIVVPLKLHGAVLGLVSLYRFRGTEPYDENDVALALTAAAHAALSIENARRYEHDHVIASTVQRRLLPPHDRARVAVETAHILLPGRNSGCWFDTVGLSGARTALIIGNVEGHGLQTAITMGQLRTVIHALAGLDLEPDEVLARLNDTADRLARERRSLPPGDSLHNQALTSTCMYAVYDPFARTCAVARAGHPAPVAVGPDGSPVVLDVPEGPPLFSDDSAPVATATVRLDEGSVLAFLTGSLVSDARSMAGVREALAIPGSPAAAAVRRGRPQPARRRPSRRCRAASRQDRRRPGRPGRDLGTGPRPDHTRHGPLTRPGPAGRVEPRRGDNRGDRTHRERADHQRGPLRNPAAASASAAGPHPDL